MLIICRCYLFPFSLTSFSTLSQWLAIFKSVLVGFFLSTHLMHSSAKLETLVCRVNRDEFIVRCMRFPQSRFWAINPQSLKARALFKSFASEAQIIQVHSHDSNHHSFTFYFVPGLCLGFYIHFVLASSFTNLRDRFYRWGKGAQSTLNNCPRGRARMKKHMSAWPQHLDFRGTLQASSPERTSVACRRQTDAWGSEQNWGPRPPDLQCI